MHGGKTVQIWPTTTTHVKGKQELMEGREKQSGGQGAGNKQVGTPFRPPGFSLIAPPLLLPSQKRIDPCHRRHHMYPNREFYGRE